MKKRAISLRWAFSLVVALGPVIFSVPASADVIGNADLVGGSPTLTLAPGWTEFSGVGFLPISGLLDGVTANTGNGRWAAAQSTGSPLSSSNYHSIVLDFLSPYEITDIGLAHDYGGAASQEIQSMDVILNGPSGLLASFSVSGLEDNVISDIDAVLTAISVAPVTQIEFRITDSELPNIEAREFVITGNQVAIPEPATVTLIAVSLLPLGFVGWRRRRR
jgi:hypothetical protein